VLASADFHSYAGKLAVDDERQRGELERKRLHGLATVSFYHTSPPSERSAVPIILGLGALSALSYAASSGVKAYNEYKASLPPPEEQQAQEEGKSESKAEQAREEKKDEESKGPRENIFVKWLNMETGYYEGGFEDTMTKQEAALILGVRQSSSPARIKEAHR